MNGRSRALAGGLFGTWFVIAAAALFLAWSNRSITTDLRSLDSADLAYVAASGAFTLVFAMVGMLVASRVGHPIGWLLLAGGILWVTPLLFEQYGLRGLVVSPGSLPLAGLAIFAGGWILPFVFLPLALILLLFPTGTMRSRRWRPLLVIAPVATLLVATPVALSPTWSGYGVVIGNPVGLEGSRHFLQAAIVTGVVLMLGIGIGGVVSLVLRFRASLGVERQQIKWLASVAAAEAVIVFGIIVANLIAAGRPAETAVGSIGWGIFVTTLMLGMPLAIGIAILRYRLYDIDRLINRTLVYGLLTLVLGGLYVGVVVGFGALVGGSGLLVAASTLLVAALFRPARGRIQALIDRRFYRKKYDAARTLEAFSGRLREEVDLEALSTELVSVVRDTMQPAHASLWLRPQEAHR